MAGMPQALPAGFALVAGYLIILMLQLSLFIMPSGFLDPSKCVKGYLQEPSYMKVLPETQYA